jgi:hypothetical protein
MNNNLKKQDVVINLHEKGFTDDFQLIGSNLLWVQGQTYLRRDECSVLEFYEFAETNKATEHSRLILGIQCLHHNAKGILIQELQAKEYLKTETVEKDLKKSGV